MAGKGPGNDRRAAIRAEMDTLRAKQSTGKASRSKLFEQLEAIQEGVKKKVNYWFVLMVYFFSLTPA